MEEETRKDRSKETRKYFGVECKKLAENISNIRRAYGETQSELGMAINVLDTTISQYESRVNTPGLYELMGIAHHYGLTIERLIYGDYHNKILNDEIYVYGKRTMELLWNTLLEIVETPQA